uniref:Uncharacterized protein n=1 Tax=Hirsutella thompsonii TaxID=42368 RepID=A0A3G2ZP06_HIRTH|nr:hypothetical protein [Hirsutella thompsonii]AYP41273.1 hypothetical protein [Hirsutella thompsonii]
MLIFLYIYADSLLHILKFSIQTSYCYHLCDTLLSFSNPEPGCLARFHQSVLVSLCTSLLGGFAASPIPEQGASPGRLHTSTRIRNPCRTLDNGKSLPESSCRLPRDCPRGSSRYPFVLCFCSVCSAKKFFRI